jgi:hypothetical protein
MPTQTVRVYPGQTYDLSFGGEATVSWLGAGPTFGIVDDPVGAPDGVGGIFAAAFGAARTAYAEYRGVGFPSYVSSIAAIRIYARFLATGNGGTFVVPITGYVRPAGAGAGSSGAYFGTPFSLTSESASGRVYHDELIGQWTADPATTVAWTPATAQSMTWGVRFQAPATDPVVNGSCELDQIYLEIDYVAIAVNIDGVRAAGSALLRLFRREPDLVEITLPALAGDLQQMETFGLEHDKGPAPGGIGWGPETWRRALPIVLEKTYDLVGGTVRLLCLNPRHYLTRWWSTFLTDMGHSLDGQGIPLLHSGGGGIQTSRAQVAYVERPGNPPDGVVMAAGEGFPKYDRRGLLVEAGGATNLVLHSTFSGGSGNTFTNWTKGESGTGTVTETNVHIGFDEDGLRRAALLQVGATDASIASIVTDAISVSGPFRVRVRTKNLFGAGKVAVVIRRASDGKDWNDTTADGGPGWHTPTFVNRVGSNDAAHRDWHSLLIDPGGATTITINVGYHGEAGTAGFIAACTSVELYEGVTHIGSDLPTTTTAVTRVEDVVTINNPAEPARMWTPGAGSFVLAVTPLWNSADLAAGQEKVFWHCVDRNEGVFETILYKKGTGYIFRRDGSDAIKAVSGAALPTRGAKVKLSVRWVSTGGELGLTEYTHEIAADDVWGTPAVLANPIEIEPTATVYVGSGDGSWADAFLAHADVSPLVLLDEELERRPS